MQALDISALGRSHRAKVGKAKLERAIELTREILKVPADYRIGIVPASDTGAVEMALWSLLGARGVDMVAWESFGAGWVTDVVKQLKLADARIIEADYGRLPDLSSIDFDRDVVFTWNGTTSGVRVPNADFIPADRNGLTICDATSAAFAQRLDFAKLDVVTFSWQKVLGGEGAHGMLILSPRAVERLETYKPAWPLPKIFRLTSGGKLSEGIFKGETINTPSMLCVEDYLDTLGWAKDDWRARCAGGARRRQFRGHRPLRRRHRRGSAIWRSTRRRARTRRSACRSSIRRLSRSAQTPRRRSPRAWSRRWRRRASPTTSAPIATRRQGCASGRRDGRKLRPRGADALARLGLRRSEGGAQGGCLAILCRVEWSSSSQPAAHPTPATTLPQEEA